MTSYEAMHLGGVFAEVRISSTPGPVSLQHVYIYGVWSTYYYCLVWKSVFPVAFLPYIIPNFFFSRFLPFPIGSALGA